MKAVSLNAALLSRAAIVPLLFVAISCAEQDINPVNIYETETLDAASAQQFMVEGLGEIYVNQGKFIETATGIDIKGSIFTNSESGLIPISAGEFSLSNPVDGIYSNLEGYGISGLPDVGIFEEFESVINPGSYISLKTGAAIKQDEPDVPLQDDRTYLVISPDNVLDKVPSFEVGNSSISMGGFFLDPYDPSVYLQGEISGAVNIENASVGLSANGLLLFEPYEYSDELESIMIRPLQSLNGNIFISGEVPLPEYQVKIVGEVLVGFVLNENGTKDFFERGLEGAEFRMGANGKVLVDNTLLNYMPADVELELGRSTLIVNTESGGENFLQIAGQVNTGDLAGKILADLDPTGFLENVSFPGSVLEGYLYVTDDLDSTQFYISHTIAMDVPGIGEQELAKALLEITAQKIRAEGRMGVPGLAEVKLGGEFFYDGQFSLEGEAGLEVDLKVASLELVLGVLVDNNGFSIVIMGAVCVIDTECVKVEASVEIDWDTGEMRVCADVPGFGNRCATIK